MVTPPRYMTHELNRRIAGGKLSRRGLERLFGPAGIDIHAVPGPAPDLDRLASVLNLQLWIEEDDDTEIHTGVVEFEATLALLGHSQPLHLRIAYALAGTMAVSEWHVLVWSEGEPVPHWLQVPTALLDPQVVDAATNLIAAQAPN